MSTENSFVTSKVKKFIGRLPEKIKAILRIYLPDSDIVLPSGCCKSGRRPVGPTLRAVPNLRVGVGPNMPSPGIKNPVTDLDNYWRR
jgi:hypothetical protein